MSGWRMGCLALACALVPCVARGAEGARTLAERMAVSLTDAAAPSPATARELDAFALASDLAPSKLSGSKDVPELWLAQRSIDRDWGLSEDSTYRVVDVPGYKS